MNRIELLNQVTILIDEINSKAIRKESHEHYLKNHLINLSNALSQDTNTHLLLRAARTFMVFCTDSMNWDTPEYQSFVPLWEQAVRIARLDLNKKIKF